MGYYFDELREQDLIWPKQMVWWHDSYFERSIFANPNPVIQKYLKYLPGTYVDSIAFIAKCDPTKPAPPVTRILFIKCILIYLLNSNS